MANKLSSKKNKHSKTNRLRRRNKMTRRKPRKRTKKGGMDDNKPTIFPKMDDSFDDSSFSLLNEPARHYNNSNRNSFQSSISSVGNYSITENTSMKSIKEYIYSYIYIGRGHNNDYNSSELHEMITYLEGTDLNLKLEELEEYTMSLVAHSNDEYERQTQVMRDIKEFSDFLVIDNLRTSTSREVPTPVNDIRGGKRPKYRRNRSGGNFPLIVPLNLLSGKKSLKKNEKALQSRKKRVQSMLKKITRSRKK
jgi:hypothetical protein